MPWTLRTVRQPSGHVPPPRGACGLCASGSARLHPPVTGLFACGNLGWLNSCFFATERRKPPAYSCRDVRAWNGGRFLGFFRADSGAVPHGPGRCRPGRDCRMIAGWLRLCRPIRVALGMVPGRGARVGMKSLRRALVETGRIVRSAHPTARSTYAHSVPHFCRFRGGGLFPVCSGSSQGL